MPVPDGGPMLLLPRDYDSETSRQTASVLILYPQFTS
jgi:hypothetical protein